MLTEKRKDAILSELLGQIVFMKLIKKSCFRKNKKVVDKRQKI